MYVLNMNSIIIIVILATIVDYEYYADYLLDEDGLRKPRRVPRHNDNTNDTNNNNNNDNN